MVRQTFEAQKMQPLDGDYVKLVTEDCELIGLNLTEDEIKCMKKQRFKNTVKNKIQKAAFEYLKSLKNSHSKMENLKYAEFKEASYLSSPLFNSESRQLLLSLRTRTVSGVRSDYGALYPDKLCPLGCGEIDNIPNILSCRILKEKHKTNQIIISNDVQYEDIFSENIRKQKAVTELYRQLIEIRNQITSSPPVAKTGPVQSV